MLRVFVCVLMCSCAATMLLNVGLHPTLFLLFSFFLFLDQSNGDLSHKEDSPCLSFYLESGV